MNQRRKDGFCGYSQRLWIMIFNVVISIQAEEDLRGIFEYIAFEFLSPENPAAGRQERQEG